MGSWDTGLFDNDGAGDFVGFLQGARPADRPGMIHEALTNAADEEDYLEVDLGQEAIAAAAVVAWQRTGARAESPYAPDLLLEESPIELPGEVAALAVRALDRVLSGDSEWRELWDEAGDGGAAALSAVTDLRAALTA